MKMAEVKAFCFGVVFFLVLATKVGVYGECSVTSQTEIDLDYGTGRYKILIAIDSDVKEDANIIQGLKVGFQVD